MSSSSLVVTWMPPPPSERNGVVTSYRVAFWKTATTEDSNEEAAMMSKDLRAQLDNLRPWTNYSVTVAASTRAGQGVASTPLICTTHQDGEFQGCLSFYSREPVFLITHNVFRFIYQYRYILGINPI